MVIYFINFQTILNSYLIIYYYFKLSFRYILILAMNTQYSGNNDFEPGAGSRVSDASSLRDRTESMPFQTYMNFIWFNGIVKFHIHKTLRYR